MNVDEQGGFDGQGTGAVVGERSEGEVQAPTRLHGQRGGWFGRRRAREWERDGGELE
jgi:hypothetical protein